MEEMNIIEIINDITNFVQYFATGFLFFGAYNFAACLQREEKSEYFIVKGITASFMINSLVSYLFQYFGKGSQYYYVALIVVAGVLGLLFGRARQFIWLRTIIQKIFQRTISDNIFVLMWESTLKETCLCIRFKLKDDSNYYEGQVDKISSIYQDPTILIKYYVIEDENGNEKRNFSKCDCARMIVKWSEMEKVEIAYEE